VLSPTAAATLKDELLMRTLYTKVRAAYVEAAPATLCRAARARVCCETSLAKPCTRRMSGVFCAHTLT
jgi:hypothetical protein